MHTVCTYNTCMFMHAGISSLVSLAVSSSSSYSDLMPQFLRAVRALCSLYPYHKQALQRGEITGADPVTRSVPASPAITSHSDFLNPFQSGPNVHRAGSFGSLIDGSSCQHRNQTAANPVRLTRRGFGAPGHRRTHSQTLLTEENRDNGNSPNRSTADSSSHHHNSHCQSVSSSAGEVRSSMLDDPFEKLEMVWASLESWCDLILAEVERTAGLPGSAEGGRVFLKRRMQSVDTSSSDNSTAIATTSPNSIGSGGPLTIGEGMEFQAQDPVRSEEKVQRKRSRGGLTLSMNHSNQLAAAIVNSTPVERRVAYLRFVCVHVFTSLQRIGISNHI